MFWTQLPFIHLLSAIGIRWSVEESQVHGNIIYEEKVVNTMEWLMPLWIGNLRTGEDEKGIKEIEGAKRTRPRFERAPSVRGSRQGA